MAAAIGVRRGGGGPAPEPVGDVTMTASTAASTHRAVYPVPPQPMSRAVALMGGGEQSGVERSCRRLNEMHASKGDHLVVDSRKVGSQPREGEIIEIQGPDGAP